MGKKKTEANRRRQEAMAGQGSQETEVRIKADEMLGTIQMYSDELEMVQHVIDAEIATIRNKYAETLDVKLNSKASAEKALKKFALKNRVDLFGEKGDKVSLPHGIILYAKEDKVTIPKDAVEQIEKLGWSEGIVIVKNIDRPVIEGWNDEKLAAIGASKKPKENISWELKKQEDQKLRS